MDDSRFHFEIPSNFAAMRDVQGKLMAAVQEHGFDDESMFAIKLALEEALINAIKHGNKHAANKHVQIDAVISDAHSEFIIVDEGAGFQRTDVPDPTDESNLEKSSGRGLLLIESYMHEVSYADDGRRLKMKFRKSLAK